MTACLGTCTGHILFTCLIPVLFPMIIIMASLFVLWHFSGAANAVSGPERSYMSLLKTYFGMKSYTPMSLMPQNKAVCGYHLGHLTDVEAVESAMKDLLSLYEQGKIKPQIDTVWSYNDVSFQLFYSKLELPFLECLKIFLSPFWF